MTKEEIVAKVIKRLDSWAVIGKNEKIEGYNTVFGRIEGAKGVIITEMSLTMLGNLACGCGGRDEEYILRMLFSGKPVLLKEDGILYRKNKTNSALCSMYRRYEKILYDLGVKPFGANESGKKLITVADLKGVSTVKINKNSIISPLAADYIKENNITVIRG